jgi:hypothetical protein
MNKKVFLAFLEVLVAKAILIILEWLFVLFYNYFISDLTNTPEISFILFLKFHFTKDILLIFFFVFKNRKDLSEQARDTMDNLYLFSVVYFIIIYIIFNQIMNLGI